MNSFGYVNIVKPLEIVLEKKGYRLSYGDPYKYTYGYVGNAYVYKSSEYDMLGSISYAPYPSDLQSAIFSLQTKNIGANEGEVAAGYKKYMAIHNGKTGVLLMSEKATNVNPPDIPEWLMIAAKMFQESGYEFTDPDWVNEDQYSNPQKYLNVMFK